METQKSDSIETTSEAVKSVWETPTIERMGLREAQSNNVSGIISISDSAYLYS